MDSLLDECKNLNSILNVFGSHNSSEAKEKVKSLEKSIENPSINSSILNTAHISIGRYYLSNNEYLKAISHYKDVEKRSQSNKDLIDDYRHSIYMQLTIYFLQGDLPANETERLINIFEILVKDSESWEAKAQYFEIMKIKSAYTDNLDKLNHYHQHLLSCCQKQGDDGNAFLFKHKMIYTDIIAKVTENNNRFVITEDISFRKKIDEFEEIDLTSHSKKCFGDYITNDRKFVLSIKEKSDTLRQKLENGLTKPEIYFLKGEPGSGKTFFVEQIKNQLETNLNSYKTSISKSLKRIRNKNLKNLIDNKIINNVCKIKTIEKNLSAYSSIEEAFQDIVLDTIIGFSEHGNLILFIDEVDTKISDEWIIPRLLAPINGQMFFYNRKVVSFSNQQLIIFLAASDETINTNKDIPKSKDFFSRIPAYNYINLPSVNESHFEKVFRALSLLKRYSSKIQYIDKKALMYIGFKHWESTRELELALKHVCDSFDPNRNKLLLLDFPINIGESEEIFAKNNTSLYDIGDNIYIKVV